MSEPKTDPDPEEVFLDCAELSVDAKGRITIPEKFVRVLKRISPDKADVVGVAPTPERSVRIMPYSYFLKKVGKWSEMEGESKAERTMLNVLTSLSGLVPLDGQNRIRLSPALMRLCRLQRDAIIVGNIATMQLFDRRTFEEMIEQGLNSFDEAQEKAAEAKSGPVPVQYVINPVIEPRGETRTS